MTERIGDLIPEALAQAREAGEHLGRQRATREPRHQPRPEWTPKYRTGRPIRLHQGIIDAIAAKAADGVPIQAAAMTSGVPKSTFQLWMKRGRDAAQVLDAGGEIDPRERIFVDFMTAVEAARAQAMEQAVVAHQRLAFGGEVLSIETDEETGTTTVRYSKADRQALEWYLERSHPDVFGTRRLEVTGADGGPITAEIEVSAREVLKAKLAQVEKRLDGEAQAS